MQPLPNGKTEIVWDVFVRVFHWSVVAGFAVAYISEGEPLTLHTWAGYVIAALVALRIVWGFIGPRYARFSDFVFPLGRVLSYLREELSFRAKRYIGHSPAGGAMVIALLATLTLTTASGMSLLALSKGHGPLSSFIAQAENTSPRTSRAGEDEGENESPIVEAWEEIHETLANVCLVLVILHVGGVVLASIAHKENLPAAMIHGRKRSEEN